MATKRRTKKQAHKAPITLKKLVARLRAPNLRERASIAILQKLGFYRGKIDLRKNPSVYQKYVVEKHKLKISALKAKHTRELNAARAKRNAELAKVKRKTKPAIKSRAKHHPMPKGQPAGGRIRRTRIAPKRLENMKRPKNPLVTYVLPFNRRGGIVEWRRFTYDQLQTFLKEYVTGDDASRKRAAWREYAVREVWSFETKDEREAAREDLEEQIFGQHDHETTRATAKRKRARNRQSKHSRARGK